ncbi:MAG: hypothetical protein RQ714_06570 [Nitrosomonas sp.]|nr:hypothetical protein [Nitrosomonas sp.]
MSYSNPLTAVYRFPAATVSTAAVVGRIVGPKGLSGTVVGIGSVVTTGVTVAASSITVGSASSASAYATAAVPVSGANAVANDFTPVANHVIAPDEVVNVAAGGEATAGAADLLVMINWY